jgi:hypothetical protein
MTDTQTGAETQAQKTNRGGDGSSSSRQQGSSSSVLQAVQQTFVLMGGGLPVACELRTQRGYAAPLSSRGAVAAPSSRRQRSHQQLGASLEDSRLPGHSGLQSTKCPPQHPHQCLYNGMPLGLVVV